METTRRGLTGCLRTTGRAAFAAGSMLMMGACATAGTQTPSDPYNFPPSPAEVTRERTTVYDAALRCQADHIRETHGGPQYTLAIGDVADQTGKIAIEDGGNFVTQGWADQLVTILSRTGSVHLVERRDTKIHMYELDMADKERLGDRTQPDPERPYWKQTHSRQEQKPDGTTEQVTREFFVVNADGERVRVPYRSYRPGQFVGSDYVLSGSINMLEFGTWSGGIRGRVWGIGPDVRAFSAHVGFDLRLSDTKTTEIVAVQYVDHELLGREIGGGVGLFLGEVLLDIEAGIQEKEPIALALREMSKYAVFELAAKLYPTTSFATCRALLAQPGDVRKRES